MSTSVFDLFNIGIGPSSSHTLGPMRGALLFGTQLQPRLTEVTTLKIELFGSLAFTGKAHGTDKALLMGLEGHKPDTIDPEYAKTRTTVLYQDKVLHLMNQHAISFNPDIDIIYNTKKIQDYHPNGFQLIASDGHDNTLLSEMYFSVGGGFIINESKPTAPLQTPPPYPFHTASELFALCQSHHLSVAELMLANETVHNDKHTINKRLLEIYSVMQQSIHNGCHAPVKEFLSKNFSIQRRAPSLYNTLKEKDTTALPHAHIIQQLNLYAIAVNEENAAGGRIVTAPTNGAAGILPAVLTHYVTTYPSTEKDIIDFLLTAGAIAILYKQNASISGAEVGCQGEVGVACSMAAGALTAVLGGTLTQVENAAEIAMEHNLGLTCDPVGGLVQIPCIERNAMAANKAVTAAQLALSEHQSNKVSLDMVIQTMNEIGRNMNSIYKETSQGGLAVNVPEC